MFTVNSLTANSRVQIKSINSQSEWIGAQNRMSGGGLFYLLAKRYLFINAVNVTSWYWWQLKPDVISPHPRVLEVWNRAMFHIHLKHPHDFTMLFLLWQVPQLPFLTSSFIYSLLSPLRFPLPIFFILLTFPSGLLNVYASFHLIHFSHYFFFTSLPSNLSSTLLAVAEVSLLQI